MTVKIKNKEYELKFTFNSFKYMEDFDITALQEIESKPFKIIPIISTLLYGAVNHNPKVRVRLEDVEIFLEDFIVDGDVGELLEELMTLLQDSNFFKSLQKMK
jgi:hypothetical protein